MVGHPVDVATGDQFTAAHDVEIPGFVPLVFRRYYSTALLQGTQSSPLGPGWVHNFQAHLERDVDGFVFEGHDGERVEFDDAGESFEGAGALLNAAAFMELRHEGERIVVAHWHGPEEPVHRFVFQSDGRGAYRFVARELPSGHGLALTYDRLGRLATSPQTAEGRRLSLMYDDSGRLAELYLDHARASARPLLVARYGYDRQGHLVSVHDARGFAREYGYDRAGRMTLERGRRGGTYQMSYDETGRCIETTGEGGYNRRRLVYQPDRSTRVTDSLGRETVYRYNGLGQVESEIRPDGAARSTTFDDDGRVATTTGAIGNVITYTYDQRGNIASKTYPDGAMVRYRYDDDHQPVEVIEPDGAAWTMRYHRGALMERIDPTGRRVEYLRNERNDIIGAVTSTGNRLTISVNPAWTEVTLSDGYGLVTRKQLDLFLNPLEVWDHKGSSARFTYDELGRLVEATTPDDARRRYHYDPEGALVRMTDARGAVSTARFSAYGDCIEQVDGLGRAHLFTWDSEGQLSSVRNPKGEVARFEHDLAGRTVAIEHFDGGIERGEHDLGGRVIRRVRPDGTELLFERDIAGNVLGITSGGRELQRWKYDLRGAPVEATCGESTVRLEYVPGGRLVAEVQNGRRIEYTYAPSGKLIRRVCEGSKAGPLSFGYDMRGRLVSLSAEQATAGTAEKNSQKFFYEPDDRCNRQVIGTATLHRQYDIRGRLEKLQVGAIISRTYSHDAEGSLVEVLDSGRPSRTYQYDAADELTHSTAREPHRYRYDPGGNLAEYDGVPMLYGRGNRLEQFGLRRLERDANGQLVRVAGAEDVLRAGGIARGEQVGALRASAAAAPEDSPGGDLRLRWDPLGRLEAVEHASGATTAFGYDAFGRRVFKEHGGVRTSYWWSGDDLLADECGGVFTEYAIWQGTPAAFWQNGAARHAITSPQGVPQELLDGDGRLIWKGEHDDWGRLVHETGSARCPLRLPGQLADSETGLHYNRFRYYLPEAGQFISPDPLGFAGGTNFFRYAPNAIDWADPLGLECGRTDNHVFRALSADDRAALARGDGIAPRGTAGTIADQVQGRDTRYTSASQTIAGAQLYDSGNGIVAIGVDQAIAGGVGFVDHNNVMQAVRRSGDFQAINNASRSGEVLFKGPTPVPPAAISTVREGT